MTAPARSREPGELFGPPFELFADMLALGLATTTAALPLVTAPAALSTACELLRRRGSHGEPATAGRYFARLGARLRSAPGRDLAAGLAVLGAGCLVLTDLALVRAGLPGAGAFALFLAAVATVLLVVGLRAAAQPGSAHSWRRACRTAAVRAVRDPAGSGLVLLALATAGAGGWMLLPLFLLVPGPLALALTAIELRPEANRR